MAQSGFLLIADITGYTRFLTGSELEHAQGILDGLFKSIFAELKSPLTLSNLQGDAVLAHLPDAMVPQKQFPLDAIERIYCSFAATRASMQRNTTCTCNACHNIGALDLKVFLHHGAYGVQAIAGRFELQGPEVIRLHRLMKNSVTKTTGIAAYALVTQAAAHAIGLPDFFAAATAHVEPGEELGDTACFVYDLAPVFARWNDARRVFVTRDEPLAFESMEVDLPVPPAVAWAYITDVEKKVRWQRWIDTMNMGGLVRGRVAEGAVQHCAHGTGKTVHEIVDWRPFDYVTYHIGTPLGTIARQTAEFTLLVSGGTHLSLRSARAEGANPIAQTLVRWLMPLVAVKELERNQRESKAHLERLAAEDAAASKT